MATVFISHRTADTSAATRLADELRILGHHVWLDVEEVNVGDYIIAKINDGLGHSTYLLLCLSSSGVDAPWTSKEWMSALARQLNGQAVKVLPVRLAGSELPPILSDIKYADLALDWQAGLTAINAALT